MILAQVNYSDQICGKLVDELAPINLAAWQTGVHHSDRCTLLRLQTEILHESGNNSLFS